MNLIRREGHAGLVATNSVAQGDSREVGLDQIVESGAIIYRAMSGDKWQGSASLEFVEVYLKNGGIWNSDILLKYKKDNSFVESKVNGITPLLTGQSRVSGKPHKLKTNENKSFQGAIVLGMGFILTPEEAAALIDKNIKNKEVLFPYLNGEDLNTSLDQSASRWAINFFDFPLERIGKKEWESLNEDERNQQAKLGRVNPDYSKPVARDYPDCIEIIEEKVKPERLNGSKFARKEWWLYHNDRPTLRKTAYFAAR